TSSIVTLPRTASVVIASLLRSASPIDGAVDDDPSVFCTAVFHRATLRLLVDMHDAEPLVVAPRPLEVVQQRPVEVSPHVHARLHRIEHGVEVLAHILGALRVRDADSIVALDDV